MFARPSTTIPVTVEFDERGKRQRKVLPNAYKARRFYMTLFKQGRHPRIISEVKP